MVDMLTLVLVGASTTRQVEAGGRVFTYTPRGYEKKRERCSPPLRGRDGEAGRTLPQPSSSSPALPARGEGMSIVHFIGAGPGRAGPHHRARACG